MGQTNPEQILRWMKAAGQTGKGKAVEARVIAAGEFLERTARLNEKQTAEKLSGIDFSKPVEVVKLPKKIYVQYVVKHRGAWFTDTGLTPDLVGLDSFGQTRKLFTPAGSVPALKSTARSIRDTWTIKKIFTSLSPEQARMVGQNTRGGGVQYLVFDSNRMTEVKQASGKRTK